MRKKEIEIEVRVENQYVYVPVHVDLCNFLDVLNEDDIVDLVHESGFELKSSILVSYNAFMSMNKHQKHEMFCEMLGVNHCTDKEELIRLISESF